MSFYVIVGLGNPGSQYDGTRHNIGFMLIDDICKEARLTFSYHSKFNAEIAKGQWNNHDVLLVKPLTYMNLSGESVKPLLSYFKASEENLITVTDDLDQPHGAVKMRLGGGHGGHNGIRSLLEHLASDKFYRVKIGIDKPNHKSATASWVLHRFSATELEVLVYESFATAKKRITSIMK